MLSFPNDGRSRRLPGAIRARDVRAADLHEEPTKRIASGADSSRQVFVGVASTDVVCEFGVDVRGVVT